jgi:hypothetical protein
MLQVSLPIILLRWDSTKPLRESKVKNFADVHTIAALLLVTEDSEATQSYHGFCRHFYMNLNLISRNSTDRLVHMEDGDTHANAS